ncbi:hypothetical protein BU17DRAFT_97598 [Hysterangium stoloniferum]|nr:hypothetical protein BU17DRAFT_97598 [Hysterangium stoloniferum]
MAGSFPKAGFFASPSLQTLRFSCRVALDNEFSGHMDAALRFVATGAEEDAYGVHRDVRLLEDAMKGFGTKDERLIYRVIRSHWNRARFGAIKEFYQQTFGKALLAQVRSETSGDYREFMAAVISATV